MRNLVIVRGGGDIATGTIYKLYKCGFQVLILETEKPSAIRLNVTYSEAVYQGQKTVEDLTCYLAKNLEEAKRLLAQNKLTMLVDTKAECVKDLKPLAVIDAILAKRNLGTNMEMAEIVIGLGPGFEAGKDVHAVVETMRGHKLGRILYEGKAIKNTGVPGMVGGYAKERVIYSPAAGRFIQVKHITDIVKKDEIIAVIGHEEENVPVKATIDGILRGLLRDGYEVTEGFKVADIDPRTEEYENCFLISEKARCIAGGVLEAILYLRGKKND